MDHTFLPGQETKHYDRQDLGNTCREFSKERILHEVEILSPNSLSVAKEKKATIVPNWVAINIVLIYCRKSTLTKYTKEGQLADRHVINIRQILII